MLLSPKLLRLADKVIDSLDFDSSQYLTEESLQRLHDLFPDVLILAALDLIDQRKGVRSLGTMNLGARSVLVLTRSFAVTESSTPWGFVEYEVLGSTATHIVHIGLSNTLMSSYCTCPAFNFTVLETGKSLMCKHVLATRLAVRLGLCVKQQISLDYLATSISQRYQPPDNAYTQ
ncbi:hypothetical protein F5890DRAFT_1265903 [Lentinula detonsa]|uniref:SWIM-type domain-containing protein n=1 Tax=Lentinula detonsa TaxID=2804962 RepID=A0AA38UTM1_9AGAR|nr:hypothetical protein F5890DRAFT_1265903 [Lentinula detonsa]